MADQTRVFQLLAVGAAVAILLYLAAPLLARGSTGDGGGGGGGGGGRPAPDPIGGDGKALAPPEETTAADPSRQPEQVGASRSGS